MSLSSCGEKDSGEMVSLMHGLPNRLVVVFEKNLDQRDVYAFQEKHTLSSVPHPGGGYPHRPEIGAVIKIQVQGHIAYEIGFWPKVTSEQIAAIRDEMATSSLVYKIYENVDPEEIIFEQQDE